MVELITKSHNKNCAYKNKSVKIETINIDENSARLECGCEITFILKHYITTFSENP